MKIPFTKPATTHAEQIQLLQNRGLTIDHREEAEFYLKHINYYRLCAYWLPFESDHATHVFKPGTSFSQVLNLYIFDRELRLLVMDAIERLEISVRAQWAYHLAHLNGSHAHLDPNLGFNSHYWQQNYQRLLDEFNRADEIFIRHLKNKYSEPLPPIWAVCEIMSLGLLSRWFNNLKPMPTRKAIARVYGIDQAVLQSWLRHLCLVRNICAHHSRLWNREFTVTPEIPLRKPRGLNLNFQPSSRKIYNTLVLLLHCMDTIAPAHHWRQRLMVLISQHGIPTRAMGFPDDWQIRPIWKEPQP